MLRSVHLCLPHANQWLAEGQADTQNYTESLFIAVKMLVCNWCWSKMQHLSHLFFLSQGKDILRFSSLRNGNDFPSFFNLPCAYCRLGCNYPSRWQPSASYRAAHRTTADNLHCWILIKVRFKRERCRFFVNRENVPLFKTSCPNS